MTGTTSSVTPARFAKGLSYRDFLAQAKVNVDKFNEYYGTAQLSQEDSAFFRAAAGKPAGPAKVLVLGEDWCPDVYRGMPVIQKIAEAGGMDLRVFPRDSNLDIMNEFLNQGQFQSIPVAVFYTKDLRYICHWTERPALANLERTRFTDEARQESPGASDQDLRNAVRSKTTPRYPAWQAATVKEIRELLQRK